MGAQQVHCLEAEQRLQAYVDRALTAEEVAAIEEHLAVCAPCARCYRLETHMRATMRKACEEPCPEALKVRLRNLCADCDCDE
jgi:anti-sigma factor (TIGR02949 family)